MALFNRHDIKNDSIVTDHLVAGAVTLAKTTGIASSADVARMSCYPVITAAAEADNAIAVSIQLTDEDGASVARTQAYYIAWRCSEAQVTFTAATTGTLPSGAGAIVTAVSNAAGLLVLTLTDGSGSFAGVGSILVIPITYGATFTPGFPSMNAITFA